LAGIGVRRADAERSQARVTARRTGDEAPAPVGFGEHVGDLPDVSTLQPPDGRCHRNTLRRTWIPQPGDPDEIDRVIRAVASGEVGEADFRDSIAYG